ncbi:MAG: penicillin-binding protein 2, partial [Vicinamibacterales bacterium]|nr:penicillin-binding protein 2 [Vicinamibacterales bacterium]
MAIAEDRRRLASRLVTLRVGAVVAFVLLAGNFWFVQIVQHARFQEMAENNHQRTLALRAPRGVIYDRHGHILVENRHAFNISIVREHTRDLDRTIRLLAEVTGTNAARIREIVERHRREPVFRPILVIQDATLAQVAAVTARRLDFELPDVLVQQVPTRQYPTEALAAHLIGYVGEANDTQVAEDGVASGAIVGQSGIERVYNRMLMGEDGARRVVVNSLGREIREIDELPPQEGGRLQLTIDFDMQRAAEEAFRAYDRAGSAIVLDPRTGEVLTFVSLPAYDPNAFATGIDRAAWQALNTDRLRPLQNRAIQGRYSPGSTYKIVVATAALEEGVTTPTERIYCPGGGNFYGRFFRCHLARGHGYVSLREALEKSCNTYFYTMGDRLGIDRLHKWSNLLGLAGLSGIDLPNEVESIVPSSAWKRERTGERWYPGETISVAIGQGQLSVTPMSLALMMTSVANGGTRVVPRLVRAVDEGDGWRPVPPERGPLTTPMEPETVSAIHDGLWMAVNGAGTAGRARIAGRDVSGKTGTAQVISLSGRERAEGTTDRDLRDHSWFVFFAPRDNPEVAGVVFAEHADGSLGAPIARHIIETYFARKDGLPLPTLNVPPRAPVPAPVPPTAAGTGARPVADGTGA